MLMFLYFEILYFFGIFELLENMCHTTRAARQTLKEKENYFLRSSTCLSVRNAWLEMLNQKRIEMKHD